MADIDNTVPATPGQADAGDAKIIAEGRKRFEMCEEAEKEVRELALDDLKFRAGDQWPEDMKLRRKAARKPCLTINVLPARERQILNENRQNKPAIQVNPVGDGADEDTAEILQGIIRHIEYDSGADAAYDTALASAVRGGFGYFRILPEYEDHQSFQQVLKIKRITNPFQVYVDPTAKEADYSDADFWFQFEDLTRDEYKQQFPDSELATLDDWKTVGDRTPNWLSENSVRVCEYVYREYKKDTIVQVRNAAGETRTVSKSKLPEKLPRGVKILQERETEIPQVKWCKFNAMEVLEKTDWPGKWLGLVPVLGDELYVDGKKVLEGMVRHAKDPMRMNNVMSSELVQSIGLAPKAPFVAATGQTEGHPEWDNANTENYSVLRYEPISVSGSQVPPPQRNVAEPAIQAIAEARALFVDDTKAVTGIYDAQLGAKSNEQSGTAIGQRKVQGELSNFHFADNLARGLHFCGLQLLDLIPHYYNRAMVIRIIGEDGKQSMVKVNQKFDQGGIQKIYDLTTGKYDVTVSAGPSYQTKRQEAVATMLQIRQANPHMPPIYDDILFQNMDFPGHEEMAERAKKALPPGLADADPNDPQAQLQQTQAQMTQLAAQHQQLVAALNQANEVIKTKQIENQGKMQIAQMQEQNAFAMRKLDADVKLAVAEIGTKAQIELERIRSIGQVQSDLHEGAHDYAMQKDAQAAAAAQAQQAHQNAMEQADNQAGNQSVQSAQDAEQGSAQSAQDAQQAQAAAAQQAENQPDNAQ